MYVFVSFAYKTSRNTPTARRPPSQQGEICAFFNFPHSTCVSLAFPLTRTYLLICSSSLSPSLFFHAVFLFLNSLPSPGSLPKADAPVKIFPLLQRHPPLNFFFVVAVVMLSPRTLKSEVRFSSMQRNV